MKHLKLHYSVSWQSDISRKKKFNLFQETKRSVNLTLKVNVGIINQTEQTWKYITIVLLDKLQFKTFELVIINIINARFVF